MVPEFDDWLAYSEWMVRGSPPGRRPQILFSSDRKTRRKEFPAGGLATLGCSKERLPDVCQFLLGTASCRDNVISRTYFGRMPFLRGSIHGATVKYVG